MKNPSLSHNENPDLNASQSQRGGVSGFAENTLRKFKTLSHAALLLPVYALAASMVGVALAPGLKLFLTIRHFSETWPEWLQLSLTGFALALMYISYGFHLLLIAPLINLITVGRLKAWRGPYYSLPSIRWYIHNGITYLVRYSFLEFATPTPFNIWFYRAMGMKIGTGTVINSTHLSDPSLISLGRKVTLGGSCAIVAHYGQAGFLVLAPVEIGDHVTIGLRATIMGGVKIGHGAKIMANSVVLPKTVIPANETWGGVPARKIEKSEIKVVNKAA